jgi:hypothetical protein
MTTQQKQQMLVFFSWFKDVLTADNMHMDAAEKKLFLKKQVLLNLA